MFCLCCKPKKKSKDQQKSINNNQQNQPVQTQSVSQSASQNQPQRPPIAPRSRQNLQESSNQQIRVRNNSQENAQSQRRQGEQEQRRPQQSQPQQQQNPQQNSQGRVNSNQQSEQQQLQEISQRKLSISEIVVISNINKEQIETKELTPTKSQKQFFKYACPICWKYMNAILQTLCCRNYICHFCVEDFKNKKNCICPHCNFQGMKLVDVSQSEQVKVYSDSMARSMAKLMQNNTAAKLSQKGKELQMQQQEMEEDEDNFERDSNEVYLSNSLIPRNIEQSQFYSSQGFKGSKQQNLINDPPSNQEEERKSFQYFIYIYQVCFISCQYNFKDIYSKNHLNIWMNKPHICQPIINDSSSSNQYPQRFSVFFKVYQSQSSLQKFA